MSKINSKQKELLVDFMATNYISLFGKFSKNNGKELKNILWKRLADKLNAAGPPQKGVDLWKRVSKLFHTFCSNVFSRFLFLVMVRFQDEIKRKSAKITAAS